MSDAEIHAKTCRALRWLLKWGKQRNVQVDYAEAEAFIDALETGGDHPLLTAWEERQKKPIP